MERKENEQLANEREIEYDNCNFEIINFGRGTKINVTLSDGETFTMTDYGNRELLIKELGQLLLDEKDILKFETCELWNTGSFFRLVNHPKSKTYTLSIENVKTLLDMVKSLKTLIDIDFIQFKDLLESLHLQMLKDESRVHAKSCYLEGEETVCLVHCGYCCPDRGFTHEQNKILNTIEILMKKDIATVNYLLGYDYNNPNIISEDEMLSLYKQSAEEFSLDDEVEEFYEKVFEEGRYKKYLPIKETKRKENISNNGFSEDDLPF